MIELDLLRGRWQAWMLPAATVGAVERVDWAVLWPMAAAAGTRAVSFAGGFGGARRLAD